MSNFLSVAIAGANGRMGQELLSLCYANKDIKVTAAYVRSGSPFIGQNINVLVPEFNSDIVFSTQDDQHLQNTNILIDFTLPDNTMTNVKKCLLANCAMVIGTTGFTEQQQQQINEAATQIPILQASNMSVGINLTFALIEKASQVLGESVKVSISETHHIHKVDTPSGTAITMGEVIANSHGKKLKDCMVIDDLETKPDQAGMVKFNSIREGEVIGDHRVKFIIDGETIEITHCAQSRQIYAKGAVKAAQWLVGKKNKLYSMQDVLEL